MKRTLAGIAIGTVITSGVVLLSPGGSVGFTARPATHSVTPHAAQDPGAEGIKVHGRWTIETRNPDGSVAEIHRFENALTSVGGERLARYLGRATSVGLWMIRLTGDVCPPVGTCFMVEPDSDLSGFAHTVEVSAANGVLTLNGTATATADGQITSVGTNTTTCPASQAPATPCTNGSQFTFTTKDLETPIAVVSGQQVLATVDISFS